MLKLQRKSHKFPENTSEQLLSVCDFVFFVLPFSSFRFGSETVQTESHSLLKGSESATTLLKSLCVLSPVLLVKRSSVLSFKDSLFV